MYWIFATIAFILKLARVCRSSWIGWTPPAMRMSRRLGTFAGSSDRVIAGLRQVRFGLVKVGAIARMRAGLRMVFLGELREDLLRHAYVTVPVKANGRDPVRFSVGKDSPDRSSYQHSLALERFSTQWDHPLD